LSLKLFHKIELSLFHTVYKYYVQHVCEVGLASLSLLESVVAKKVGVLMVSTAKSDEVWLCISNMDFRDLLEAFG
jgi:hypothetical protein